MPKPKQILPIDNMSHKLSLILQKVHTGTLQEAGVKQAWSCSPTFI